MKLTSQGTKILESDLGKISVQELSKNFLEQHNYISFCFAGVRQSAVTPHEYSLSNLTKFINIFGSSQN